MKVSNTTFLEFKFAAMFPQIKSIFAPVLNLLIFLGCFIRFCTFLEKPSQGKVHVKSINQFWYKDPYQMHTDPKPCQNENQTVDIPLSL
jgi:hypothetical protein